jgi:hypothetical protein
MKLRSTPRSHSFPKPRKALHPRCSVFRPGILVASIAALLGSPSARAATYIWDGGSGVDGGWATTTNWGGDITAPGATSGTTNADIAVFNTAIANTWGNSAGNPIVIDANRNISGLTFTGATGNYFIGSTGGNALRLSSGGSIQIGSLTATNAIVNINAPLERASKK